MRKFPLLCLLIGVLASGQAAPTKPAAPKNPAAQPSAKTASPSTTDNSSVGPQTAVITIPGVCEKKPAPAAAPCKTVVTRAEFDELVQTMAPNIQPAQKKQLATQYAMALVMAHKAHEMHLDQGAKYEQRLRLAKLGVLNKALGETLQEQASNISDKDLQDYYKANSVAYEETELQRIFVPKLKPQESKDEAQSKDKPSEEDAKKKEQESQAATKKLADSLRTRAAAGEDFDKLQEEAYASTGMKNKPPTKLGKVRRNGLPPDQLSVLDGKVGDVSQPIANPSGYFIYKVGQKDTLPFDQVKQEISTTLSQQKLRDEMQAIQQSASPELNEKYFAAGTPVTGAKPEALAKPPAATKGADPK